MNKSCVLLLWNLIDLNETDEILLLICLLSIFKGHVGLPGESEWDPDQCDAVLYQ